MNATKELAILMADLSGYTAATEIHGAESALNLIKTYMRIAREALHGNSRILERVGDQIVVVSEKPDDVAITAITLLSKCYEETNFLPIHVGLHYGPLLQSEGSFFGTAINIAARITSEAIRGEILCSGDFIDSMPADHQIVFGDFRTLRFKNVLLPVSVAPLVAMEGVPDGRIDPVCKMNVVSGGRYTAYYDDVDYHFCSEECMRMFTEHRELFTSK